MEVIRGGGEGGDLGGVERVEGWRVGRVERYSPGVKGLAS